MKYAIIESSIIKNIVVADPEFAESQGWVEVTGSAGIGWFYIDGQFIEPPPKDFKEYNKNRAEMLLQQTDWTATVDVSDPNYSNPYLSNQLDFLNYRNEIRKIAINPPYEQYDFPLLPKEIWEES
jgi:hypothetical protein